MARFKIKLVNKMTIVLMFCVICLYYGFELLSYFVPEDEDNKETAVKKESELVVNNQTIEDVIIKKVKVNPVLRILDTVCFTKNLNTEDPETASYLAIIGTMCLLLALLLEAFVDALKETTEKMRQLELKDREAEKQDGGSLAEFANKEKKVLQQESSEVEENGVFRIIINKLKEKINYNMAMLFTKRHSTNLHFDKRQPQAEGSASASIGKTSEHKMLKRQSVAKLIGTRPAPMMRRSSFPALPLNRNVQSAMLGYRQLSMDSDDEADGRGRRVRLIRRF